MFFCLGTEGSNGYLFRNVWFQWFSVLELKVPKVPYLEMGGSNGFLFRNGWFQCFSVKELKVPMVPYLDRKSVV